MQSVPESLSQSTSRFHGQYFAKILSSTTAVESSAGVRDRLEDVRRFASLSHLIAA